MCVFVCVCVVTYTHARMFLAHLTETHTDAHISTRIPPPSATDTTCLDLSALCDLHSHPRYPLISCRARFRCCRGTVSGRRKC